ncbi:MAG TPA: ferritin-like domain-containing protein, partial [Steroidobacteraceae bacterium]|nr:ferritin-like domain-containing protein [Steroidobacteraceae bacterium]
MQQSKDTARYAANRRDELDGSALYAALAAAERDPSRKDLFTQLSQAEAAHAEIWRQRLIASGVTPDEFQPSLRTRFLAKLARYFGPAFVLPTIAAAEYADQNKYSGQKDSVALAADERGHAAVVAAVAGPQWRPGTAIGEA